jgi:hypothetical protein
MSLTGLAVVFVGQGFINLYQLIVLIGLDYLCFSKVVLNALLESLTEETVDLFFSHHKHLQLCPQLEVVLILK